MIHCDQPRQLPMPPKNHCSSTARSRRGHQPLEGLERQQIRAPVVLVLAELDADALERIRRVAPLVAGDEAAIEQLEGHAPALDRERATLPEAVLEMKLGVGLDRLELVDVAVVALELAEITTGILELDRESERVEDVLDPEVGAGPQQQRIVGHLLIAAEIVAPELVAGALLEAEVEPVELLRPGQSGRIEGSHVGRRLGLAFRAVAAGLDVVVAGGLGGAERRTALPTPAPDRRSPRLRHGPGREEARKTIARDGDPRAYAVASIEPGSRRHARSNRACTASLLTSRSRRDPIAKPSRSGSPGDLASWPALLQRPCRAGDGPRRRGRRRSAIRSIIFDGDICWAADSMLFASTWNGLESLELDAWKEVARHARGPGRPRRPRASGWPGTSPGAATPRARRRSRPRSSLDTRRVARSRPRQRTRRASSRRTGSG